MAHRYWLKRTLQAIHLMKGKHMKNSTSTIKKVNKPTKNEPESYQGVVKRSPTNT